MANKIFLGSKTYIMGILNITKDSFVPSSRCNSLEDSLSRAEQIINSGTDIIDIGAESTRPGSVFVEEKEEIERVIPVVKQVVRLGIPVSIDTYKSSVAKQALDCGAFIVNDVSGGRDPEMLTLVKEYKSKIVLMHNKIGTHTLPHAKQGSKENKDIVGEVLQDLEYTASRALAYGISSESIILDPGIGFQKNWKDSLRLMKNINRIKKLGYAILVGASNKEFIGKVLCKENPEKRQEGTLACTVISAMQGADIVRVHDVKPNVEVAKMTDYIYRNRFPPFH